MLDKSPPLPAPWESIIIYNVLFIKRHVISIKLALTAARWIINRFINRVKGIIVSNRSVLLLLKWHYGFKMAIAGMGTLKGFIT